MSSVNMSINWQQCDGDDLAPHVGMMHEGDDCPLCEAKEANRTLRTEKASAVEARDRVQAEARRASGYVNANRKRALKALDTGKFIDGIGEAMHTGLRKGTDAEDAHRLWTAIYNSKTTAWPDAANFAAQCLEPFIADVINAAVERAADKNKEAT